MCENKEPKILENDHKIDSGFSDLVIMEVDGTWSTVGIQSHKALDLDKLSQGRGFSSHPTSNPWTLSTRTKMTTTRKEGAHAEPQRRRFHLCAGVDHNLPLYNMNSRGRLSLQSE
ncbi:hypothetical protein VPH35_117253 [Triticum aestivum]